MTSPLRCSRRLTSSSASRSFFTDMGGPFSTAGGERERRQSLSSVQTVQRVTHLCSLRERTENSLWWTKLFEMLPVLVRIGEYTNAKTQIWASFQCCFWASVGKIVEDRVKIYIWHLAAQLLDCFFFLTSQALASNHCLSITGCSTARILQVLRSWVQVLATPSQILTRFQKQSLIFSFIIWVSYPCSFGGLIVNL